MWNRPTMQAARARGDGDAVSVPPVVRRTGATVALALVVLVPVVVALRVAPPPAPTAGQQSLPDFDTVTDADKRKERFLAFLEPVAEEANADIRARRERIGRIAARAERDRLLRRDDRWLTWMADHYDLDGASTAEVLSGLRRRVDVIPVSLTLAQAAIESGWGRSRFAREGNNLFGEWCFSQGCGLVPAARPPNAEHEVRVFPSVGDAVRSYMRNLNSHPAYAEFRAMRMRARTQGREPTGEELAAGLEQYSERGQAYVEQVRHIIRSNDLE